MPNYSILTRNFSVDLVHLITNKKVISVIKIKNRSIIALEDTTVF